MSETDARTETGHLTVVDEALAWMERPPRSTVDSEAVDLLARMVEYTDWLVTAGRGLLDAEEAHRMAATLENVSRLSRARRVMETLVGPRQTHETPGQATGGQGSPSAHAD